MIDTNRTVERLLNISNADLIDLRVEGEYSQNVSFKIMTSKKRGFELKLKEIGLLHVSRSFGEKGNYFVGEIKIKQITSEDHDILRELKWGMFDTQSDNPQLGIQKAFWLHIDGGIVIDIVFNDLDVNEL